MENAILRDQGKCNLPLPTANIILRDQGKCPRDKAKAKLSP
jgi:hypothetical protein